MKFVALMLLLILGRYRSHPRWAEKWGRQNLIPGTGFNWFAVLLCVAIAEYLLLQTSGLFWAGLILAAEIVLLYLLLPHWSAFDIKGEYYTDWCRGDYQAAFLDLSDKLSLPKTESLDDCREVHYAVCHSYVTRSLIGFFTLLLWFFLLGMPGVFIALWALWLSPSQTSVGGIHRLARLICWLPGLLLGFTFFAVGNGRGAYDCLQRSREQNDSDWLFAVALGAIGDNHFSSQCSLDELCDEEFRHHAADEINALVVLIRRSAVLWLIMFGVFTMIGFESPLY